MPTRCPLSAGLFVFFGPWRRTNRDEPVTDLCCTLAGILFLALLLREMVVELVRAGGTAASRPPEGDCPPSLGDTDLLRRLGYYEPARRPAQRAAGAGRPRRRAGRTAGRA